MRRDAVVLSALLFAIATKTPGQSPPDPSFETASIRPVDTMHDASGGSQTLHVGTAHQRCVYTGDRATCRLSLAELIREAWQLQRVELKGPDWLDSGLFAVNATMPDGTTPQEARRMLQTLLRERFALQQHREVVNTPVYALLQGRKGAHLQPADEPEHQKLINDGPMVAGRKPAMLFSRGRFTAVALSMEYMAVYMNSSCELDHPVVDRTGLEGKYKVDLRWDAAPAHGTGFMDPGFCPAAESTLGLRLEKQTIPLSILVVDSATKEPTRN